MQVFFSKSSIIAIATLLMCLSFLISCGGGGNTAAEVFELSISNTGVKTLTFSWNPYNVASYYKLMVNPDSVSGYSQYGSDINGTTVDVVVPVHLTDWINASYFIEAYDADNNLLKTTDTTSITSSMISSIGYFKASNTDPEDYFGNSVALSDNGSTLAVGAYGEDSAAAVINGTQSDNSASQSGAVYIYTRNGTNWSQQAYIKAANSNAYSQFGYSVALSVDGNTLAVGAINEDDSGAVYIYIREGEDWSHQAYVKASNADAYDHFGISVALNGNGDVLAVGAFHEDSSARGINGNQSDNSGYNSGAAYIYKRTGTDWSQLAYFKASNSDENDYFGHSVALSDDGAFLAVGAYGEDSAATGINGDQSDNTAKDSGAVYIYTKSVFGWIQQAYIKASNSDANDYFGWSVGLDGYGIWLAVGAYGEDSAATGVNGDQDDNTSLESGAAYFFRRDPMNWYQQNYIKASNTDANDMFGFSVTLSKDGATLAVGASGEDGISSGVNGNQSYNSGNDPGAVYLYTRCGFSFDLCQRTYVKASNTDASGPTPDYFGYSVNLNSDGNTLAVGAPYEDSAATGINGDQSDNTAITAGAVYIY